VSAVKVFRVSGRIEKPHLFDPFTFNMKVAASEEVHAREKIYAEMGSRHRAKRHQIMILSVEEVEGKEEV
jgi:ribosomal protein L20A (L18A)